MTNEAPRVGPTPEEIERIATPRTPDPQGPGRPVLVCVAWPYANGHLHLGHLAGSLLPPDIFARFHRMRGDRVLMVSGSDCHGTPIMLTAEKEGKSPAAVVDHYNTEHIKAIRQLGIAFDLFTKTTTDNHRDHVQDIFTTLLDQGYLEKRTTEAPYDPDAARFLPDRYVEGTCPHCGYTDARGDQCDECGKTLDPHELIAPHPKGDPSGRIEFRPTEHFFFLLSRFQDRLQDYVADKAHWRPNTINFTRNWLQDGLQDRPITRDLTWGVPIPLPDFEDKRLYVWFEAVCGYYTASLEWAEQHQMPDAWRLWWEDPTTEAVYFLGKDNIPFHTIIWPSILMGFSEGRVARGDRPLVLPHDVPANEFLNLDGKQFSKSRGIGIWVPDVLRRFDPDVVRYYLSVNMPENRDSNWTWEDFVAKVNDELVDTFGNLVHRALTFTEKHFGSVPDPGTLSDDDRALIARIHAVHAEVTDDLAHARFKKGLRAIMALAQEGNRYFAAAAPWALLKQDPTRAAPVLHTSLYLVRSLCLMLAPYLPFATDRLWRTLGETGSVHEASWEEACRAPTPGTKLQAPDILFRKLDLDTIIRPDGDPTSRPGPKETTTMPHSETQAPEVTIDEFQRMDLRVATVTSVEDHPDADRLFIVRLDVGDLGERQVCAGLKRWYRPDELTGKQVVFIANLRPVMLRGVESQGMILAGERGETVRFLTPERDLPPGAKIR